MTKREERYALCCCGTPLVTTLEQDGAEWYCVTCETFWGYLHARAGSGDNPTAELAEQYEAAKAQYDAERAARKGGVVMTATLWRIDPLDTWALSVCEVAGIAGAHVEGCYVEVPGPTDVLRLAAMFPAADVVGMADGASITIPTPTWGDVTFWTALEPVVVPAQDGAR